MNIKKAAKTAKEIFFTAFYYELKGIKYFANNIYDISRSKESLGAAYYFASLANNGNYPKLIPADDYSFLVVLDNGDCLSLDYIANFLLQHDPSEILYQVSQGIIFEFS